MGVTEKKILWIRLFLGVFANHLTVKNDPSDIGQTSSPQVHSPRCVFRKTKLVPTDPFPNEFNSVSRPLLWHRQSVSVHPTKIKEQSRRKSDLHFNNVSAQAKFRDTVLSERRIHCRIITLVMSNGGFDGVQEKILRALESNMLGTGA